MDGSTSERDDVGFYLKNMHLKAIIKENHGKEITQIQTNTVDKRYQNILATVGSNQVNVYDLEHMGNYLDLMLHYVHTNKGNVKTTINTGTWVSCKPKATDNSPELQDDAYYVFGGEDTYVYVISIKRTKVVARLAGHSSPVVEFAQTVYNPSRDSEAEMEIDEGNGEEEKVRYLLSASKDGVIILWKVDNMFSSSPSALLQKWDISEYCGSSGISSGNNGFALTFSPSGNLFLVGCPNGNILHFQASTSKFGYENLGPLKLTDGKKHSHQIDCIRFLDNENIISKSVDGRILHWNIKKKQILSEMKVPNSRSFGSKFDVDKESKLLCAGNSEGVIYLYDYQSGKTVHKFDHRRSRSPVRSCCFAHGYKTILYVANDCHIWKYDYIDPSTITNQPSDQDAD